MHTRTLKTKILETSPPTAQYHDKMTKVIFSQIKRKLTIQRQTKKIVRKPDRSLFEKMLIITQSKFAHEGCAVTSFRAITVGTCQWLDHYRKQIKQYLPENWKSLLHQLKRSLNNY